MIDAAYAPLNFRGKPLSIFSRLEISLSAISHWLNSSALSNFIPSAVPFGIPTSIGYVQRLDAAPEGFAAVRRPTGGGIVYHDYDFTFSVAFPMGHWLTGLDRTQSYNWLNRSLQAALQALGFPAELSAREIPHSVERATMVCFTNPTRYDLLLEGRKVAGSAQRRTSDGLLHQASLHFGKPLPMPREAMTGALVKALGTVMEVSMEDFSPSQTLLDEITRLVDTKYGTDAWNNLR